MPEQLLPSAVASFQSALPPHPPYQLTSLHVVIRDHVLFLSITAADGFPRLNRWALTQLRNYMTLLNNNSNIHAAIITGTEKCFAAGAELAEVSVLTAAQAFDFADLGQSTMRAIEKSRKPVIAAIRGYCMGGGFDLAMACHVRVATLDVALAHRGATLGLLTGWGGTQRLQRIIGAGGRSVALELMASGRFVNADEAHSLKLISKIVATELLQETALSYVTNSSANAATNL